MKLWRIPHEWDFHQLGGVFVVAETKEEARALAMMAWDALPVPERDEEGWLTEPSIWHGYGGQDLDPRSHSDYDSYAVSEPEWDKVYEIVGGVFFQNGGND